LLSRFLVRLFIKDHEDIENPDIRSKYGYLAGIIGIFANLVLFTVKLVTGLAINSIAFIGDAFNNLTDVLSSLITILGFKLAGKPATFKVKVNEVKRKEFPELTDEFVQEVSDFETLAELKADILNKLKEQEAERSRVAVQNEIVAKAVAASEVAIPNVLVEREIDAMLEEMNRFLALQGLTLDKYLELSNKKLDDFRADRREEAQRRVKTNLVLDAIIAKEGITASDAEIDERLQEIAANYKQDLQKVKDAFTEGQLSHIEEEIKYRKVIEFLTDEARITENTVPAVQEDEMKSEEEA